MSGYRATYRCNARRITSETVSWRSAAFAELAPSWKPERDALLKALSEQRRQT